MSKKNPHWGSTLDDFLQEEGIRDHVRAEAMARVVAWQITQDMKRQDLTRARLAEMMQTSRVQDANQPRPD